MIHDRCSIWLGIWSNLISGTQSWKDFCFVTFCSFSVSILCVWCNFTFELFQFMKMAISKWTEPGWCVCVKSCKVWHHQRSEIVCCANQKGSFCLCYILHMFYVCQKTSSNFSRIRWMKLSFPRQHKYPSRTNFRSGRKTFRVENVDKDVIVITATVSEVSFNSVAYSRSCFQECRVGFFFRVIKFHHRISIFMTETFEEFIHFHLC